MGASTSTTDTTTTSTTSRMINWCPMPTNQKQNMPRVDGQVALLDTELPTMKVATTNPTGAVAVAQYQGQTFCFQSSCPTCQIPLTKARILPAVESTTSTGSGASGKNGAPRLVCDLCQSTYSLGTGQKLMDAASGAVPASGIWSSVVQSVFSANSDNAKRPLKLYKLGEKANGQLVICVD